MWFGSERKALLARSRHQDPSCRKLLVPAGSQVVVSSEQRTKCWPSITLKSHSRPHLAAASRVQSSTRTSSPFSAQSSSRISCLRFFRVSHVEIPKPFFPDAKRVWWSWSATSCADAEARARCVVRQSDAPCPARLSHLVYAISDRGPASLRCHGASEGDQTNIA